MPEKQHEQAAERALAAASAAGTDIEKFCLIWNGSIKPILQTVKLITGPKVDKQIDDLSHSADLVCSGEHPDVMKYCTAWRVLHLESVLRLVETFVGPKVKQAIETFITISDSLCPTE